MGKRFGLVLLPLLALVGCADAESAAAPAETVTVTATPEAAPITAQAAPAEDPSDPEAEYLAAVKEAWLGEAPSDEELLTAGRYACDQFPSGAHYTEVVAVEGDDWQAQDNNLKVTGYAGRYLCPEYDPSGL